MCVTINQRYYDPTLIQTGIGEKHLLNDKSSNDIDDLKQNFIAIVNKHKSFGLGNIFVSRITCNKWFPYSHMKKVNEKVKNMSKIYAKDFYWKWQYSNMNLYQINVQLLTTNKCFLAEDLNFVKKTPFIHEIMLVCYEKFYLEMLVCSEKTYL